VANESKWNDAIGIWMVGIGIFCIGLMHHLIPPKAILWHNIFQNLFVLPIVVAALYRGWAGGLMAAILSGICSAPFLPNLLMARQGPSGASVFELAEVVDFILVGLVAGILSDRERKQKDALNRTTQQLSEVYRELQENFERMRRPERLYAVGQLSAGLAHEIRNPLASIWAPLAFYDETLRRNQNARNASTLWKRSVIG
jgi:two-component system, NtrC family, sensor histidine kinase HydH